MKRAKKIDNTDELIDGLLEKISPRLQEEINYRMNLASKIYQAMKAKGWTQSDFADKMKKKPSVICRWLSGTHNFESDTLFEIQRELDIVLLNTEIETKVFDNEENYRLKPGLEGLYAVNAIEQQNVTIDSSDTSWKGEIKGKIASMTLKKQDELRAI